MSVDITWRKLFLYRRLKKKKNVKQRLESIGSNLDKYNFKTCSELQTTFIRKDSFGLYGAKTLVELAANIVNTFPLPSPLKWTSMDVSKWLTSLQLSQYRVIFCKIHNYIPIINYKKKTLLSSIFFSIHSMRISFMVINYYY